MSHPVATHHVAEQPIVAIRSRFARGDIPSFIKGAFEELYGHLARVDVDPAGPPFVIYHEFGDEIDAEVCVPVGYPLTGEGRVVARTLPAATVARTLHMGPYEGLGDTYAELYGWIGEHGFVPSGQVRERYLTGGEGVAPDLYRTEIDQPITPALVPVGVG